MGQASSVDAQYNSCMSYESLNEDDVPSLSPSSSATVSRETSNASTISKSTTKDLDSRATPVDDKRMTKLIDILKATTIVAEPQSYNEKYIYNEIDGLPGSIHINTKTWDEILE